MLSKQVLQTLGTTSHHQKPLPSFWPPPPSSTPPPWPVEAFSLFHQPPHFLFHVSTLAAGLTTPIADLLSALQGLLCRRRSSPPPSLPHHSSTLWGSYQWPSPILSATPLHDLGEIQPWNSLLPLLRCIFIFYHRTEVLLLLRRHISSCCILLPYQTIGGIFRLFCLQDQTVPSTIIASSRKTWLKNLSETSIKLNGKNYLLWSQAFETFLGTHRQIRHLTDPPKAKDVTYKDWLVDNCVVILWLVNSMDEDISKGVMMLRHARKIWETLHSTYGHDKNIAQICEIYK